MANDYVPDLIDLAPGELARSADVNERYSNTVSGFDKLPTPKVGEKGFSDPVPVGTPVNQDHAVTKDWAETAMTSQLAQATTQAGNAATSAAQAATSATNASTSATNSQSFAAAASTSANNAAISEGNAASSASSASTSASNAAASASSASTSASNAASSASSASTSAASALAAKNAAELAYDQFDDRYLGAKTSNPIADNDNNTLVAGALYFNSVAGEMRVWTGTQWLAAYLPPETALLQPGDNVSELVNDAGYLTGNQTITLSGGATGSGTTNIPVTIANDSHTHDGRYYTEGEVQSILSGSTVISGYNKANWDAAYNDKVNSAAFSTLNGNLTLTQQDGGTVTVNLDGRYLTSVNEYTAGGGLTLTGTQFAHADTSAQASSNNSGQVFIQDITLDTYGHITAIGTGTAQNTTYTSGSGLSLAGTVFSHADTSSQSSVNNTGNTFIKGITLDEFGHITAIASGAATDTNTTYSAGNGISLSGTTFSVGAGSGLTQQASGLAHADTSTQASVNNSGDTVIQDITLDTYGHITAIGSKTLALGASYAYDSAGGTPTRGDFEHHIYHCWSVGCTLNLTDASWQAGDYIELINAQGSINVTVNATRIYLPDGSFDTQVTLNSAGRFRLFKYTATTGYWMLG